MKLDDACATFTPEIANSSYYKTILNESIFYLNHRLNIFNFFNLNMEIKIHAYLKDLSLYRLSDISTDICV